MIWHRISDNTPKDGRQVLLSGNCVFPSIDQGKKTTVVAHWTEHNGGGWVWHGAAMNFTHWAELPMPSDQTEEEAINA